LATNPLSDQGCLNWTAGAALLYGRACDSLWMEDACLGHESNFGVTAMSIVAWLVATVDSSSVEDEGASVALHLANALAILASSSAQCAWTVCFDSFLLL
jgi:hypothetical protein